MKRWVWHVTTWAKLQKYQTDGRIRAPVRAWEDLKEAERFSIQTGRKFILRLLLPEHKRLEGHKNKAVYSNHDIDFQKVRA